MLLLVPDHALEKDDQGRMGWQVTLTIFATLRIRDLGVFPLPKKKRAKCSVSGERTGDMVTRNS